MVCPNCHSDQIIAVQDQHFCINCGQMVPEQAIKKMKTPTVAVGENGLPEGVKILPVSAALGGSTPELDTLTSNPLSLPTTPAPSTATVAGTPKPTHAKTSGLKNLVTTRPRMGKPAQSDAPKLATKKRKPGRPKAGRLDVPLTIASTAPVTLTMPLVAPSAPAPITIAAPIPASSASARRLSDIAPRRLDHTPQRTHSAPAHPATIVGLHADKSDIKPRLDHMSYGKPPTPPVPKPKPPQHHVHKLGVPPLHFGAILGFSLRARVRPRLIVIAALSAISFAVAISYGVWLLLNGGLPRLATSITQGGTIMWLEAGLLGLLYYVGRSVSQAAIIYGVAREADQRPVTFSRQLGIGVNTFGRRLMLDLGVGLMELLLLAGIGVLVITGGGSWPVHIQVQIATIFASFLIMIYLLTSLGLARGLAGVALTLTAQTPWAALKLGWSLFSHRFELVGLRLFAVALELLLAMPLAVLAVGFITSAPAHLHLLVALGVGLLAWLAGALFGAGTASWWSALYRKLVTVDRTETASQLLSGRPAADANRGSLVFLVALSSFIIAAALALPWLRFL